MPLPLLYSYRRCPYAMRARLALHASGISHQIINIDFKNKPQGLLEASPKGTVPVLITTDGQIIDESLDIMFWALHRHDPHHWLPKNSDETASFERALDDLQNIIIWGVYRIKYPDRYPESEHHQAKTQGQMFFQKLNQSLASQMGWMGERTTLIDMAALPFVRQWHHVAADDIGNDMLYRWLLRHTASDAFQSIMHKYQSKVTQP